MQPEPVSVIRPSLTPRPPTPPRESANGDAKLSFFERILHKDPPSRRSSNITPELSTESTNQTPTGTSRGKKVEWSEWTEYKDPPSLSTDGKTSSQSSLQPLPPSAERKPVKSILKATTKLLPPHKYKDFGTMLESIVQQLAGNDRLSKMDSYEMLSGVLKASENIPELRALKEKMGLLLQFIQRDCSATHSTGTPDTPLTIQALTLLSSFLYKPAIAELLTLEFTASMVEHATKTLEDPGMSKDVAKHLMFILAQPTFPAKTMNADKVGKLITVLHNLNNDGKLVKGKSIAVGRLNIYRNLLRISKPLMLVNTEWLADLFTSMLSDSKEVRTAAIAFGFDASLAFGTEGKISRAFMDMFQSETESRPGVKFADLYAESLRKMIREKDHGGSVPRIWSVSVLFLRHRAQQFEQWAFMKPWLKIIEDCFNSSDQQTKVEANSAWNRLVFAIRPDDKTSSKNVNMLRTPLTEQLKRKDLRKSSKIRKAALGSVYNLLYYSLKPNSTSDELDLYWDAYVSQFLRSLTPANITETPDLARENLNEACRILRSLFDSTTPRIWKETRAVGGLEVTPMTVNELPAIDPKWLRKSASNVFPVLEPLLEKLYWDLGDQTSETNSITILWKTYITSIASAAVKEIKVSNDTMVCLARIFSFLYKVWNFGPKILPSIQHPQQGQNFLASFDTVISTTIEGLGLLPFTEKLLSMGNQHQFIAIATPSHRPGKSSGEIRSPLHHLFVLLTAPSPNFKFDGKFSQMVRRILTPFFDARKSSKAQMELVKDLLQLLPSESSEQSRLLWRILADFATTATDTRDVSSGASSGNLEQPLGGDYRNVVKILEIGLDMSPHEVLPGWKGLFEALVTSATLDAGDGGRAIAVIEPVSRILLTKLGKSDSSPPSGLSHYHMLLSKTTYPKNRLALDAARRKLWGTASGGSKHPTFDPYNQLYEYMCQCLGTAYTAFDKIPPYVHLDVISATTSLLARCPSSLLTPALVRLQMGLACWIKDENLRLNTDSALSQAVTSLWTAICTSVPQLITSHSHTKILDDLEFLICSGLESQHKSIVNAAITMWNSSFGSCRERLEYPESVQKALLRLRPIADLQLPFFPESLESEESVDAAQPIHFAEAQDDTTNFFGSTSLESVMRKHHTPQVVSPMDKVRQSIPQVIIGPRSVSGKRSREETPELGQRKSRKRDSTPRLRHDDSQIQFEAIHSSPVLETVLDSQLLTDRQKEVKERQQAEAAMFPDLRSSPGINDLPRKKAPTDSELPSQRSSSSSRFRKTASPPVERQTTPTIVPAGDEDNFVTSSPTPTRSLHGPLDVSEPPSSPPETTFKERLSANVESRDDTHIPSSPPELPQDPESETTTSVDPSAQIDPYAIEQNRTLSTLESSPGQQGDTTMQTSSVLLEVSNAKTSPVTASAEGEEEQAAHIPDQARTDTAEIERPGTPIRAQDDISPAQQTPKTPNEVFVDARSSPIFSDPQTVNDDVFEDAVSSPRLNMRKPPQKQSSSPVSDFDQSSMLRLVSKFDNRTSQADGNGSFVEEKENSLRRTRSSLSKDSGKVNDSPSARTRSSQSDLAPLIVSPIKSKEAPTTATELTVNTDQIQKSSSFPSLISETPLKKPLMAQDDDDEENIEDLDPDSTIVVDTGELDWAEARIATRSKGKSKKRKHDEVDDAADDQGEVPDSQDVKTEVPSPTKRSPKRKRKGRGRQKRSSQLSPSQQAEPSAGQEHMGSPSEVDLDAPLPTQDEEEPDIGGEAVASSAKATSDEQAMIEQAREDEEAIAMVEQEEMEIPQTAEDIPTIEENLVNDPNTDALTTSALEIVAETTFDETSWAGISDPDPAKSENAPAPLKEDAPAPEEVGSVPSSSPVEAPALQTDVGIDIALEKASEVPAEEEAPTAQSIQSKLQSVISDFASAILSREEVNAFEDMFMDAKEMLYGAGRRGRGKE